MNDKTPHCYNYHPETGEFISTSLCDVDPLNKGRFLTPAHTTLKQPPEMKKNEVAVYLDGEWVVKSDFRGQKVDVLGQQKTITDIEQTPDDLMPSAEDIQKYEVEQKRQDYLSQLEIIDRKSIRPARTGDQERLDKLEAQAAKIRKKLKGLG